MNRIRLTIEAMLLALLGRLSKDRLIVVVDDPFPDGRIAGYVQRSHRQLHMAHGSAVLIAREIRRLDRRVR